MDFRWIMNDLSFRVSTLRPHHSLLRKMPFLHQENRDCSGYMSLKGDSTQVWGAGSTRALGWALHPFKTERGGSRAQVSRVHPSQLRDACLLPKLGQGDRI